MRRGPRERNGIRLGQRVRDVDGTPLGRVTRLYEGGFAVRRGIPILVHADFVARYDEVRGIRDGALVVARSARDLIDLARGELPPSWRTPAPPGFPTAATPSEAALLRDELAHGTRGGAPTAPAGAPVGEETPPRRDDEERAGASRGQSVAAPPQHL